MADLCKTLQSQVAELDTLQRAGSPEEIVQKLICKATLQLVQLKKQIEASVQDVEATKSQTSTMRAAVDQHFMQLQSHLYEKNHYNKEIAACRSFRYKQLYCKCNMMD